MSGNSNATLSMPGRDWQTLWPPSFAQFQLDIVGFLAILGEGSVTSNHQVAALSKLFYLPRLIPAPQALLWPTRRVALEPTFKAFVTGVESGNVRDQIHHVASVLLSKAEDMPTYTVRCIEITKVDNPDSRSPATFIDRWFRGQPPNVEEEDRQGNAKSAEDTDTEAQGPPKMVLDTPSVKPRVLGPLARVTLLGFAISVALFTTSIIFGDGMSMIATILLSLLSTLVGVSNKWSLQLAKRRTGKVPKGDVVIRYIKGSFLIVECDENVARELFFAPEEIDYDIKPPWIYRSIALLGTLMLMLGVIALANARLELQFGWAGAYIVLNAAYWIAAAVPAEDHWDFSCYTIEEKGIECEPDETDDPTFTDALWTAIRVTKSRNWCRNGQPAAPMTKVWDKWLDEAEKHAQKRKEKKGVLKDPKFPVADPANASIYGMEETWDAKGAWKRFNTEANAPQTPANNSAGSTSQVDAAGQTAGS